MIKIRVRQLSEVLFSAQRQEIWAYYARNVPSSPVPMLLRRAQRLVGCDFLALMKELAPGGIDELQRVTGPLEES